jgi:hypothetical protein
MFRSKFKSIWQCSVLEVAESSVKFNKLIIVLMEDYFFVGKLHMLLRRVEDFIFAKPLVVIPVRQEKTLLVTQFFI